MFSFWLLYCVTLRVLLYDVFFLTALLRYIARFALQCFLSDCLVALHCAFCSMMFSFWLPYCAASRVLLNGCFFLTVLLRYTNVAQQGSQKENIVESERKHRRAKTHNVAQQGSQKETIVKQNAQCSAVRQSERTHQPQAVLLWCARGGVSLTFRVGQSHTHLDVHGNVYTMHLAEENHPAHTRSYSVCTYILPITLVWITFGVHHIRCTHTILPVTHSIAVCIWNATASRCDACLTMKFTWSLLIINWEVYRVGQNHIYTVYIRYFWESNH